MRINAHYSTTRFTIGHRTRESHLICRSWTLQVAWGVCVYVCVRDKGQCKSSVKSWKEQTTEHNRTNITFLPSYPWVPHQWSQPTSMHNIWKNSCHYCPGYPSNLKMTESIQGDVHGLYANTMPFIWDLRHDSPRTWRGDCLCQTRARSFPIDDNAKCSCLWCKHDLPWTGVNPAALQLKGIR